MITLDADSTVHIFPREFVLSWTNRLRALQIPKVAIIP
jgi:hypothetical protein